MTKRVKLITIVFFIIFIASVSLSWAISEDKLVSSAEKVVSLWQKLFSKDVILLGGSSSDNFRWATKMHLIEDSFSYDVKRTDSIVSPYQLIINFKINYLGTNLDSPNANGIYLSSSNKTYGFKTAEDALKHMNEEDLKDYSFKMVFDLQIYYALQKGSWVFKDGNENFNRYIGRSGMTKKENLHLFKDLFKIPVK